jgi:hypothetical protein
VHLFNGSFFCPLKGQDKRMATPGGGGAAAAAATTAAAPTVQSIVRDLEALSRANTAAFSRYAAELTDQRGKAQQAVDRAFQASMIKQQAVICIVLLLACCVTVL